MQCRKFGTVPREISIHLSYHHYFKNCEVCCFAHMYCIPPLSAAFLTDAYALIRVLYCVKNSPRPKVSKILLWFLPCQGLTFYMTRYKCLQNYRIVSLSVICRIGLNSSKLPSWPLELFNSYDQNTLYCLCNNNLNWVNIVILLAF